MVFLPTMEKIGKIEVSVVGNIGVMALSPDNYDINDISALMQNMSDLLYPNSKKERPLITYDIQEGSVKNIFKTSIQTVIGFSAVLSQIIAVGSIDFLDLKAATAIENFQNLAFQKNYEFRIKTEVDGDKPLIISPQTNYFRSEDNWVDAEFYFYGIIKDAGGKNKSNIHLDTEENGYLTIEVDRNFLSEFKDNLLYKRFGIRARGKQNSTTGEIDTKALQMLNFVDYNPTCNDDYLNKLISKAKTTWKGVDTDEWLKSRLVAIGI